MKIFGQTKEQRFIADCAKEGMYRQLVEAVGDALDGELSTEQARWFPCARAVQQQREVLDQRTDELAALRSARTLPPKYRDRLLAAAYRVHEQGGASAFLAEVDTIFEEDERRMTPSRVN